LNVFHILGPAFPARTTVSVGDPAAATGT